MSHPDDWLWNKQLMAAKQREAWRLLRTALSNDYGVRIDSKARLIGEARITLTFTCVFDIPADMSERHLLEHAESARRELELGVEDWQRRERDRL
jgi:hypothetical protein